MASESDWETVSEAGSHDETEWSGNMAIKCLHEAVHCAKEGNQCNNEEPHHNNEVDWQAISEGGSSTEVEVEITNKAGQFTEVVIQPINKLNLLAIRVVKILDPIDSVHGDLESNSSDNEIVSNISELTDDISKAISHHSDLSDRSRCGPKVGLDGKIKIREKAARVERAKSNKLARVLSSPKTEHPHSWSD